MEVGQEITRDSPGAREPVEEQEGECVLTVNLEQSTTRAVGIDMAGRHWNPQDITHLQGITRVGESPGKWCESTATRVTERGESQTTEHRRRLVDTPRGQLTHC